MPMTNLFSLRWRRYRLIAYRDKDDLPSVLWRPKRFSFPILLRIWWVNRIGWCGIRWNYWPTAHAQAC